MRRATSILLAAAAASLAPPPLGHVAAAGGRASTSSAAGDPVEGKRAYQACMGCHALDDNDVGPRHRDLLGRTAGSVPDYAYSPALRNSRIIWSRRTLDLWLQGPQKLVPGAKMYFSVPNAKTRADIIAYLATETRRAPD